MTIKGDIIDKNTLKLYGQDALLIFMMASLAACGLIYQYILSHYAGRVLGVMEHAIYTMIGVMIVAMGAGSFLARYCKCSYTSFGYLEAIIALIGAAGILMIGGSFAVVALFPQIIAENFHLPMDMIPQGSIVIFLGQLAKAMPFIIGGIIGIMIGMEIPLIARIREGIYQKSLAHNVGTIYGADYVGAGLGAAIYILYMMSLPPQQAALYTAMINLLIGFVFLIWFFKKIKRPFLLLSLHILLFGGVILLNIYSEDWHYRLENSLYKDEVVFSKDTNFQHITLTKQYLSSDTPPIHRLYLNGRLQFSSDDEHIYHNMLVHPAILAARKHDDILIIGGGDGLALRTVLQWNPQKITLLELDKQMVDLFSKPQKYNDTIINAPLLVLNQSAFLDPRATVIYGDAFHTMRPFMEKSRKFDVIIIDLPDPSHPDLNKLYSLNFYKKIKNTLSKDGALVIQSTSPYHAKKTFLTVGVTLKSAGFKHVDRYQQNVPNFGQWGWTIATIAGKSPKKRISQTPKTLPDNIWATKDLLLSSFEFHRGYFDTEKSLKPNILGSHLLYLLHQQEWMEGG